MNMSTSVEVNPLFTLPTLEVLSILSYSAQSKALWKSKNIIKSGIVLFLLFIIIFIYYFRQ